MNTYVADGTVLAPQACFVPLQFLLPIQTSEDVIGSVLVGMKFRDVVSHILLAHVAQEDQFSLVRSQDGSVGSDRVHREHAVFQEVCQLGLIPVILNFMET